LALLLDQFHATSSAAAHAYLRPIAGNWGSPHAPWANEFKADSPARTPENWMKIPLYQVNAFTDRLFSGNPAAICPLQQWLPDAVLLGIAAENNLAETAYYIANSGKHELRWFTPTVEVDLCGHATLATAYVIWEIRRESSAPRLDFNSKGGPLAVEKESGRYVLDFPSLPPTECKVNPAVVAGLGKEPLQILGARDYLCVFENEDQVRRLKPDMATLAAIDRFAVIATAPGRDCDFVSRFFAPAQGVPEDPVTGSAHCTLTPYWARRLAKTRLRARQVSLRGGELWCEDCGDRVRIGGHAVKFLEGEIDLSENVSSSRG
jgi:PhzF family phenazine biosynthesis protein